MIDIGDSLGISGLLFYPCAVVGFRRMFENFSWGDNYVDKQATAVYCVGNLLQYGKFDATRG